MIVSQWRRIRRFDRRRHGLPQSAREASLAISAGAPAASRLSSTRSRRTASPPASNLTRWKRRILQDADRLDAIGAIGVARCFYVAGRMGSALYDPDDFDASRRAVDDRHYAIDHFKAKLFPVAEGFRTGAGRAIAAERAAVMRRFIDQFRSEVEA